MAEIQVAGTRSGGSRRAQPPRSGGITHKMVAKVSSHFRTACRLTFFGDFRCHVSNVFGSVFAQDSRPGVFPSSSLPPESRKPRSPMTVGQVGCFGQGSIPPFPLIASFVPDSPVHPNLQPSEHQDASCPISRLAMPNMTCQVLSDKSQSSLLSREKSGRLRVAEMEKVAFLAAG